MFKKVKGRYHGGMNITNISDLDCVKCERTLVVINILKEHFGRNNISICRSISQAFSSAGVFVNDVSQVHMQHLFPGATRSLS